MIVPNKKNKRWEEVILREKTPEFEFLATQMLMGELTRSYLAQPTPERMMACISNLHSFFEINSKVPKVQSDLKKIFE